MRILLFILIFCLFLNPVLAESPQEIESLIVQGEYNLSKLNNDLFLQVLLLDEKLTLMNREDVLKEVSLRASKNISFLNDYDSIRKYWFENQGILFEGAKINSIVIEDGKSIVFLKGVVGEGVTFDLEDNRGSKVNKYGHLILQDGSQIYGGRMIKDKEGFLLKEGRINLDSCKNSSFSFFNSSILKGNNSFFSMPNSTCLIHVSENSILINGSFFEKIDGDLFSSVKGSQKILNDGTRILGQESFFSRYENGQISRSLFVSEEEIEYLFNKKCVSPNCVSELRKNSGDYQYEFSGGKGRLIFQLEDENVDSIAAGIFNQNGSLTFKGKNNEEILVNEEGLFYYGDLKDLSVDFKGSFNVKGVEFNQAYLKGGKNVIQEGVLVGGIFNPVPSSEEALLYKSEVSSFTDIEEGEERIEYLFEESYIKEGISVPLEGGNLLIRTGSFFETYDEVMRVSQGSKQSGISFVQDDFQYMQEIYQLESSLISPSLKKEDLIESSTGGSKNSLEEAIFNALCYASSLKQSRINSMITSGYFEENQGGNFQSGQVFSNKGRIASGSFIKNYEVIDYGKDKKGNYWANVRVSFGQFNP